MLFAAIFALLSAASCGRGGVPAASGATASAGDEGGAGAHGTCTAAEAAAGARGCDEESTAPASASR